MKKETITFYTFTAQEVKEIVETAIFMACSPVPVGGTMRLVGERGDPIDFPTIIAKVTA